MLARERPRGKAPEVLEEFFNRDVECLRRLRHPNVVRLLDAGGENGGERWPALEWLERGTLADADWRNAHRDSKRLLVLLRDLLSALGPGPRRSSSGSEDPSRAP